ncbi:MAG: hypothetical protein ACPGQP_02100 [Nitrosopumilus sp.]
MISLVYGIQGNMIDIKLSAVELILAWVMIHVSLVSTSKDIYKFDL